MAETGGKGMGGKKKKKAQADLHSAKGLEGSQITQNEGTSLVLEQDPVLTPISASDSSSEACKHRPLHISAYQEFSKTNGFSTVIPV